MSYRVIIAPRAIRDPAKLPEKIASACAEFIDGPLATDPWRLGKPLFDEFSGLHGARRGSCRIVYRIDDDEKSIEIVRIAHRGKSYHR
ncbi:type II toxin-antitoxin system RelE family toxin [Sciscionella marina]|uniref:type II toxin-antitoxin system RelE family toxin n=1 Tax=Sciscionella marina TaxID=508770 RepID=UPI0003A471CD|nr:type II toxin-antitoxin system RelE/ParE family toxin [Sciscionella marina]